jgi:hypothetical protein
MNFFKLRSVFPILSLACLIACIVGLASAQSVVRGRVRQQTRFGLFPAAKVEITCQGTDGRIFRTYTDSEGWYYFYDVSPGTYTVAVPGSTQQTINVSLNVPVPTMAEIIIGTEMNVPKISVTPSHKNFHKVKLKRSETARFVIKNNGKANLSMISAITGPDAPMFTITSGGGHNGIKPDESLTIKIAFKPTSLGSKFAKLEITSDDPNTPKINIPLGGTGE